MQLEHGSEGEGLGCVMVRQQVGKASDEGVNRVRVFLWI